MYGLVRKEITEMYAFTACLWLKAKEGGIGTPFSYSVPGQTNELVLLQGVRSPVELLINDKVENILFIYFIIILYSKKGIKALQQANVGFSMMYKWFCALQEAAKCIRVHHQIISH